MRKIYMTEGTYHGAFLVACAFGLAGFVLTFVYRFFAKKKA